MGDAIRIVGAREANLKNITLEIPKNRLVVFTGLSGSGKSTLLIDVLMTECQRQYLEAMSLQGIHKPKVERVQGASPCILISQSDANKNPRSTVGTLSDIYTDLRMVYEKSGVRRCPFCGELISAAECRETTCKDGDDFRVFMDCAKCGRRMDKLTRTDFSFNTREGACPVCEGLGKVHRIVKERTVDERLSLEEGAVLCWEKQYSAYQRSILAAAFAHYGLPDASGVPVSQFDELQKAILYEGAACTAVTRAFSQIQPPKSAAAGRFEGVFPILRRRLSEKSGDMKNLEPFFETAECPDCRGERLNALSRSVTVNGLRLPELSGFSLENLYQWTDALEASVPEKHEAFVKDYLRDIKTKLNRFLRVGIGYLTLNRQVITLSGGELQRLRLAAVLDSELSGILYILDEPTAGLHPKDTAGLVAILKKLRDLGNTVLVIEHDEDVMKEADYIVDMGPGAGKSGGEVVAFGTLEQIRQNVASVTGRWLSGVHPGKESFRKATGELCIAHACRHNLKDVTVTIPTGCMTAVTGPSGSGKSTLVFEVLAAQNAGGVPERSCAAQNAGGVSEKSCAAQNRQIQSRHGAAAQNAVLGLEQFDRVICVEQSRIARMKRSNVATYSDIYGKIRDVFARTEAAKKAGLSAKHFSFNTPGGRCETCEGMGYVDSNMLFFADTQVICPACGGHRFHEDVLSVRYQGRSIREVLSLSVADAAAFFADRPSISKPLALLCDVGLGYLELGQSLTTLSGGEGQRLKLAWELLKSSAGKPCLYLLDEPTCGLHPQDVEHFLVLLNRIADEGNTVVVVEHNRQLTAACDWKITLGPGGGDAGGEVVFCGRPQEYPD